MVEQARAKAVKRFVRKLRERGLRILGIFTLAKKAGKYVGLAWADVEVDLDNEALKGCLAYREDIWRRAIQASEGHPGAFIHVSLIKVRKGEPRCCSLTVDDVLNYIMRKKKLFYEDERYVSAIELTHALEDAVKDIIDEEIDELNEALDELSAKQS